MAAKGDKQKRKARGATERRTEKPSKRPRPSHPNRTPRRAFYDFESCVHFDPLLIHNEPLADQARHSLSPSAWAKIQRTLGPPQGYWSPESYRLEIESALGTYCTRPRDRTATTTKGRRIVLSPERLKARPMLGRANRIARAARALRMALLEATGETAETHRRLLFHSIGRRMGLGVYAHSSAFHRDTEALLGVLEKAAVTVQPIIRRDVRSDSTDSDPKKKPADPFLEALICDLGDIVQRWTGEPLRYNRGKWNKYGDADWKGSFYEVLRLIVQDVPRLRARGGVYDVARTTLDAHGRSRRVRA